MSRGSGDGFVQLADGSVRWGRYGAAGVLARHLGDDGTSYFVALRSHHCHQGGTWAIPGGALDHGETPVEGAVREFTEEIGPLPAYEVVDVHEDDHGGWAYWTVVVDVAERLTALAEAHRVDELVLVTITHDHGARLRSYELVARAMGLQPRLPGVDAGALLAGAGRGRPGGPQPLGDPAS